MQAETIMITLLISIILCGCSLETFFDGGAPIAIITLGIAIACCIALKPKE